LSELAKLADEVKRAERELREARRELEARRARLRRVRDELDEVLRRRTRCLEEAELAKLEGAELRSRAFKLLMEARSLERGLEDEEGLRRRLEELEWRHQVSSLTREAEREMVKRMAELAKQVKMWERVKQLREEASSNLRRGRELRGRWVELRMTARNLAERGSELRGRMAEERRMVEEAKKAVERLKAEVERLKSRLKSLLEAEKDREAEEARRRREEAREVVERLRRGERVALEELKEAVERLGEVDGLLEQG
jgi:uncharacterized coiled-coil DUF342 family protein